MKELLFDGDGMGAKLDVEAPNFSRQVISSDPPPGLHLASGYISRNSEN
jgi:hypothetical protein